MVISGCRRPHSVDLRLWGGVCFICRAYGPGLGVGCHPGAAEVGRGPEGQEAVQRIEAMELVHPRDQLVAIMNRIYHGGMTTLSDGLGRVELAERLSAAGDARFLRPPCWLAHSTAGLLTNQRCIL